MTTIGIDPSMNSTGICINEDGHYKYKLLATHPTKKLQKAAESFPDLDIIIINKEPTSKGIQQAINTTKNISYILYHIRLFLTLYRPDYVTIEAPAFAATGRVADLAGLNHAIRLECLERNIPCYPVPPTTVKMQAVGNGQATKEMIVKTWLTLFPEYKPLETMKIDDLADAWAVGKCVF